MKIGIVTYWFSEENYGQLLQCYALQRYLRDKGYDAFLVLIREKTNSSQGKLNEILSKIKTVVGSPLSSIGELKNKINKVRYAQNYPVSRKFSTFIRDHIKTTNSEYTVENLYRNPPEADLFICGSDQIWGGYYWFYYLDFVPQGIRKMSYAASFGGMNDFTIEYKAKLIKLLQQFNFLSLREKSGVEFCHKLGFENALKMPDPTLLLNRAEYDEIREDFPVDGKYVLLYLLGNKISMKVKEVFNYAQSKGLNVIYIASQDRYDKYRKDFPTIGQWVDLIAKAELVVTNSFHGTVFSAMYHKPFIVIPLIGSHSRMNTRIDDFLSESQLKNRIYKGHITELAQKEIDFTVFEKIKASWNTYVEQKFLKAL